MHILIVDDSEITLRCLELALSQAGHTVDKATDGEQALANIHKCNYRLVISDWEMPGMDGLELCRRVRAFASGYVYFILVTSHRSTESIVAGLEAGADEFIAKPFKPAELLVRIRVAERLLALETRDVALSALAKLAESRDSDTGLHIERVRGYSHLLSKQLSQVPKFSDIVGEAFVRLIYETSPLHDIGKVGIPDEILLKAGPLTDYEEQLMKQHTLIGKETLDAALEKYPFAEYLRFARDIVACHHEQYDGHGYPLGLAGDDIPLSARIVAVADVYDALRSKRAYKDAFSHSRAREIILQRSGTHFDPDVVDAFLAVETEFASVAERLADSLPVCPPDSLLCRL